MKKHVRLMAMGLSVLLMISHDATAQSPTPPAPSKQLPVAEAPAVALDDQSIVQTSHEVAEQPESTPNPLDELAWMVGDWVDKDEQATIESSVNWTKNGKFLTRSFRVIPKSGDPKSGMQVIGWDPAEKTIRSWTYDADGGFGEERWRRSGDRWTMRTKYTLPDGASASATNVMRRIDDDTYTWKSVNRTIAGALQPDIDEVTIVRKNASAEPPATARPADTPKPADGQPEQGPVKPAPTPTSANPETENKP